MSLLHRSYCFISSIKSLTTWGTDVLSMWQGDGRAPRLLRGQPGLAGPDTLASASLSSLLPATQTPTKSTPQP